MRRITLALLVPLFAAAFAPAEAQTHQVGRIVTPLGEIRFLLDDRAPNHKAAFLRLAATQYWDTLTFNRVIPNFVAQGGCPDTPEGFGHFPELLQPEFHDSLKHTYGAVGAGRDDNPGKVDPGCQFYIVANRQGLARLHRLRAGLPGDGCGGADRPRAAGLDRPAAHADHAAGGCGDDDGGRGAAGGGMVGR